MEEKRDGHIRFERRDILRLMTAMPGAAFISVAPFVSAPAKAIPDQPASRVDPAAYQPKVLDPHEWKTVHVLCDWIIPADQTSGSAVQAGVPEFIDDWLDFKGGNLVVEIRGGLTGLDTECNRSFGHDFVDCTITQQKQILDRIAYPQNAAPADASAVTFFNRLRDLVVSGFFTSEPGIADLPYLGNEPQSEWYGCPAPVLAKLGLDKGKAPA